MDQNGITFNDVKTGTLKIGNLPLSPSHGNGLDEDGYGIINAVDIDWNNAQFEIAVENSENQNKDGLQVENITTTGDLLAIIAGLQAQVDNLTVLVKGLYTALTTDTTN